MKTLFYLIFAIIINGCTKNENEPEIIGKWKQIEIYGSDGGASPTWHPVSNGYYLEFLKNGNFTSTKFSECNSGTFNYLNTNEVNMTYNCSNFSNNYIEIIESNTHTILILKPSYMECDEGCSVKFEKING